MRKPRKCPSCGHAPFASILRGLPHYSDDLERDLEAGRVVLGGCSVSLDDPAWACSACGMEMWSDGRMAVSPEHSDIVDVPPS